jgi:hypothetical protein
MKTLLKLTALVILIFSYGCTEDGKDGKCFISIDWEYYDADYGVYYYSDNNPAVPSTVTAGVYYESAPGTYSYEYESEDYDYYYSYTGTYTLISEPGTDKTFFKDGIDGEDSHFDLYLTVYKKKGAENKSAHELLGTRIDTVYSNGRYMVINENIFFGGAKK